MHRTKLLPFSHGKSVIKAHELGTMHGFEKPLPRAPNTSAKNSGCAMWTRVCWDSGFSSERECDSSYG